MADYKSPYNFIDGLKDGIPIGLGYLSVSFGFGIMAVSLGLPVIAAVLTSMMNLTSAGQVAGITIIASGGSLAEMALAQLIINIRYALMSLSLSQKLDGRFGNLHRFIASFGITDEIFAVSSSKSSCIGQAYFYGIIIVPYIGWALGTLLGAVAGEVLPQDIKSALGIAIYGMFLAIFIPQSRRDRGVLICVAIAAALSCLIKYLPIFSGISQGFSVIICAVAASAAAAFFAPIKEEICEVSDI